MYTTREWLEQAYISTVVESLPQNPRRVERRQTSRTRMTTACRAQEQRERPQSQSLALCMTNSLMFVLEFYGRLYIRPS